MNKLQLSKFFSEAVCDFIYDKLDNVRNEWEKADLSEKFVIFIFTYTAFMVAFIFTSLVFLCLAKLFFETWIGYIGLPLVFTYWTLWAIDGGKKDE